MPFPQEHSCRLKSPSVFDPDSFRRMKRMHEGKGYSVIMGKLKGEDTMTDQACRYDRDTWTAEQAGKHCQMHKGHFEAAAPKEARHYPMMERKTVFEFKQIADRVVTGYPSVFGNVDDGGDLVLPGAYTKTLQERGSRVRFFWQHDHAQPPIAKVLEMAEIGRDALPPEVLARAPGATGALRVKREYLATPRGEEVLTGIREGAIEELSIGYDPIQARKPTTEESKGELPPRRVLQEIRLWELSDVNWGMNAAAVTVKSFLADLQSKDQPTQAKAIAEWLESQIHMNFTVATDEMFGNGYLTREERIALSGLIGTALDAFHTAMQAENDLEGVRVRERGQKPGEMLPPMNMPMNEIRLRRLAILAKQLEMLR